MNPMQGEPIRDPQAPRRPVVGWSVWNGTLDRALVQAQQRPAPPLRPREIRRPASDVSTDVLAYVTDHPGSSWRTIRRALALTQNELNGAMYRLVKLEAIRNTGKPRQSRYYAVAAGS